MNCRKWMPCHHHRCPWGDQQQLFQMIRTWNKAADHVKHRSDCITLYYITLRYITTPPPLSRLHYCQHWLHYYSPNIVSSFAGVSVLSCVRDMVVFFLSRTHNEPKVVLSPSIQSLCPPSQIQNMHMFCTIHEWRINVVRQIKYEQSRGTWFM